MDRGDMTRRLSSTHPLTIALASFEGADRDVQRPFLPLALELAGLIRRRIAQYDVSQGGITMIE